MSNELLEAALGYAKRGWPIFPVRSNKQPYTNNGVLDATTDQRQIEAWWATCPRANIALDVAGAGMLAIDIDPGHDPARVDALGLPKTRLIQRTPRGGDHRFYRIPDGRIVSPSVGKLAAHVDVRSFHSYVLLSPSRTADGSYSWLDDGAVSNAPESLIEACNKGARQKDEKRDTWLIEPDLAENIASATQWLSTQAKPAIEGRGGDACAYATAAMLKSYGISQETAFELMWEHWNPRCSPPWQDDELERKIENGYQYNTSPPGNITSAYRIASTAALFTSRVIVDPDNGKGRVSITADGYRFADRAGMGSIPPVSWLIPDLLPANSFAMMFGKPGTFKTFLALDMALTIACHGYAEAPVWPGIQNGGKVLFAVGEGRSQLTARVKAWERLHFGGSEVSDFVLVDPVPTITRDLTQFLKEAKSYSPNGYSLIVIDTLSRAMSGTNENSQEHATKFVEMVGALQADLDMGGLNAAVLAIHHSGLEHDDRARGSSVFLGAVDAAFRIDREEGSPELSLTVTKQKDAPEAQRSFFTMQSIQLTDQSTSLTVARQAKADRQSNATQINLETLDRVVCEILELVPGRQMKGNELAQMVADDESITGVEAKTIENVWLPRLHKGHKASAYYDRLANKHKGKWCRRATGPYRG